MGENVSIRAKQPRSMEGDRLRCISTRGVREQKDHPYVVAVPCHVPSELEHEDDTSDRCTYTYATEGKDSDKTIASCLAQLQAGYDDDWNTEDHDVGDHVDEASADGDGDSVEACDLTRIREGAHEPHRVVALDREALERIEQRADRKKDQEEYDEDPVYHLGHYLACYIPEQRIELGQARLTRQRGEWVPVIRRLASAIDSLVQNTEK